MPAGKQARRTHRRRPPIGRILFVGLYLLFVLAPLYWVFVTSIKPSDDYLAVPPVWFPSAPTTVHYTAALFAYHGLTGLVNSVIISVCATILSCLVGTLMAYSLARFNTGGPHLSFWCCPGSCHDRDHLPLFLNYRLFGLQDTHLGLILAYTVFTLPVSVWMMFAYFRQMPRCSRRRRWSMAARAGPLLARRGAAGGARYCRCGGLRVHCLLDRVLLRHRPDQPKRLHAADGVPRVPQFSGSAIRRSERPAIVSLVPSIILGVLVQKHLVRGLTLGAIRG